MYYIIENDEQLNSFYNFGYSDIFVEPIYFDSNLHPILNHISLLYVKPICTQDKGYIICVDHSESFSVDLNNLEKLLNSFNRIYIRDAKTFKYNFYLNNLIDISFNIDINLKFNNSIYRFFEQRHNIIGLNKIIPLVKHFEICEDIFEQIKKYCYVPENIDFINKFINVFYLIEQNGIKINHKILKKYFNLSNSNLSIHDDFIYTQYNLHNITGRPSNRFNGINFAALNKDNGCRNSFIPSNNQFVEIDIKAYHPTLVSQLINFNFDNENPYEYISKILNVDISESKLLTFRQLYGGINPEYKHVPFFQLTHDYINKIWNQYNEQGYIKCDISGHVFLKNPSQTPQKLFNYILQNLETSNNVLILWEILRLLNHKNTKIILYTYDSILLDYDNTEINVLSEILNVFTKFKLKTKVTYGKTYGDMV